MFRYARSRTLQRRFRIPPVRFDSLKKYGTADVPNWFLWLSPSGRNSYAHRSWLRVWLIRYENMAQVVALEFPLSSRIAIRFEHVSQYVLVGLVR